MSDIPLSYLPGNCTQLRVKVVGDLAQCVINDSEITEVQLHPEDPDAKEINKRKYISFSTVSITLISESAVGENLKFESKVCYAFKSFQHLVNN